MKVRTESEFMHENNAYNKINSSASRGCHEISDWINSKELKDHRGKGEQKLTSPLQHARMIDKGCVNMDNVSIGTAKGILCDRVAVSSG